MTPPGDAPVRVHATGVLVAVDRNGPLCGILLKGPSGVGKSALALDLVQNCPWRRTALISDDIVEIYRDGDALHARTVSGIRGLIEVRGFGPTPTKSCDADVPITVCFDLSETHKDRIAAPDKERICGIDIDVWPLAMPGNAGQIRAVLRAVISGQMAR
ncbi:MAG: hypothetical protein AAF850_04925 [Pseudomonadota bacterium]